MKALTRPWTVNQVILAAALFLTAFANLAFFRNLHSTFAASDWGGAHLLSLAMVLLCVTVLFLSLLSFRRIIKPALIVLFLLSAATAYFMDTYNIIIDREMIVNVVATDAAETQDLLTTRLLIYVLMLGVLPSVILASIRIAPAGRWESLRARLLLSACAFALMISLALISSAFYASFIREHKELRYYANPLTPLYSLYRFGTAGGSAKDAELMTLGVDARIPPTDIDRELVVMVVGETARADRFSLNGYRRETNPELANENLVSFTQVSACGTTTAISVPCMFSLHERGDFDRGDAQHTENALDVLAHAGVNLLWRDNNSNSKGVADRIAHQDFRSPEVNPVCDGECRDEGMLAGLQEYIQHHNEGDILIVLHQMGSHGPAYSKRYPPEFRIYTPTCETSELDKCSELEIGNSYDNTIRYTDHFLAGVIGMLREYDDRFETAMLYVSDHGESLGESGMYLHGLPNWIAPETQTRVPVILWFGKNYDDADIGSLKLLQDEPLAHENVFHTLLGLFEVHSGIYDAGKDLLQKSRDLAAGNPGAATASR